MINLMMAWKKAEIYSCS